MLKPNEFTSTGTNNRNVVHHFYVLRIIIPNGISFKNSIGDKKYIEWYIKRELTIKV